MSAFISRRTQNLTEEADEVINFFLYGKLTFMVSKLSALLVPRCGLMSAYVDDVAGSFSADTGGLEMLSFGRSCQ